VKWEPHSHIDNWDQSDASGTVPTHGLGLPREPNAAQDETQIGVAIRCLLHDARSAEPAASTRPHQSIMEEWIHPAREPDERQVSQIPQSNGLSFRQCMARGHRQDHSILRDFPMRQFVVPGCDACGKPRIQSAGQDGFDLMNRKQMMQLQLHVGLPTPQFAKSVYHHPVPGYRGRNADAKRTGLAMGDPPGATLRLIDVLQDASRIAQE